MNTPTTGNRTVRRQAHDLLDGYRKSGSPQCLQDAVRLLEAALADETVLPSEASAIRNDCGRAHLELFLAAGSAADLDRAVECFTRASSDPEAEHRSVPAGVWNNLGIALAVRYEARGTVEDLHRSAEAIQHSVQRADPKDPALPSFWGNYGNTQRVLYERTGDPLRLNEALLAYQQALDGTPEESPERAGILNGMSTGLVARFCRQGAESDLQDAVAACEGAVAATNAESPVLAERLNNLGMTLATRYEAQGSIEDLRRSAEIFAQAVSIVPPPSPERPRCLNNLGLALLDLHSHIKDPEVLNSAIEAFAGAVESAHGSAEGPIYSNNLAKGQMRQYLDDPKKDPSCLNSAIAALGQIVQQWSPDTPTGSLSRNNRAVALRMRFESEGNLEDLDQAIHSQCAVIGGEPTGSVRLPGYWNNLAALWRDRFGRDSEPESMGQAIRAFRHASAGGLLISSELALQSSKSWGDWALQRHSWKEAAEAYGYAEQAVSQLLSRQLGRAHKEQRLMESQNIPARLSYSLARSGDLTGAMEALEVGSARLLTQSFELRRHDLESLEAAHPALARRLGESIRRLEVLERTAVRSSDPAPHLDTAAGIREARASVDGLLREVREFEGFQGFWLEASPERLGGLFEDVAGEDEAWTCVAGVPEASFAVCLTRDAVTVDWFDFSGLDLSDMLLRTDGDELVGGHLHALSQEESSMKRALGVLLRRIGTEVVQPLGRRLGRMGIGRLVVFPFGHWSLIPLHAAPFEWDGRQICLLDLCDVMQAPNAQVLASARRAAAPRQRTTLLAVADPQPETRPLEWSAFESRCVQSAFRNAAALESAAPRSSDSFLLMGDGASRQNLLEPLASVDYLHFSCHGRFDLDRPGLSGLALADGGLTVLDLLYGDAAPLRARLAVLSSCQTAISDPRYLPDESVGLPGAFLQAGVAGVVGSLWAVNDLSTALLMTKFYRLHLGLEGPARDPAAALRQAQLWLRDADREDLLRFMERIGPLDDTYLEAKLELDQKENARPYRHPYYWASFVVTGS